VRGYVCLVLATEQRGEELSATAVTLSRLKASIVDKSLVTLTLTLTVTLTLTLALTLTLI
jgi:hypothetical protein